MAQQHISMRGEAVDFNKLRLRNAEKPALGNANMNARGDIIGENGIVIKTQEQVEAEYAARMAEQQEVARPVNLKDRDAMMAAAGVKPVEHPAAEKPAAAPVGEYQAPPGLAAKVVNIEEKDFEPEENSAPKSRRKIVESD